MKTIEGQLPEPSNSQAESKIKQQIYEKVKKRMAELASQKREAAAFCPELNPDVIVISDDQTMLFEPQHRGASEWLYRRFGLGIENEGGRIVIRVHPILSPKIIQELKAAGFGVNC